MQIQAPAKSLLAGCSDKEEGNAWKHIVRNFGVSNIYIGIQYFFHQTGELFLLL